MGIANIQIEGKMTFIQNKILEANEKLAFDRENMVRSMLEGLKVTPKEFFEHWVIEDGPMLSEIVEDPFSHDQVITFRQQFRIRPKTEEEKSQPNVS